MFEGYSRYTKDRRRSGYTDYIREKAFDLDIMSINTHESVVMDKVLEEKRSVSDYCQIILCLQEFIHNYDCIEQIVRVLLKVEPISSREWYMGLYDIMRESKVVPVFCSWFHSGFLGRFHTPNSPERIYMLGSLVNQWIQSPVHWNTPTNLKLYKLPNGHYGRIVNHQPIIYPIKTNWTKDNEQGEWKRIRKILIYTPYSISWTNKCKWSPEFIEENRRKLTLERQISFNSESPWIRIECGNRFYYKNKKTKKQQRIEPDDGFCDINITDIYYFDTQYPIFIWI